jgi:hypothetical protein
VSAIVFLGGVECDFSLKAKNYRNSLILRYDMLAALLPIVYNNGN